MSELSLSLPSFSGSSFRGILTPEILDLWRYGSFCCDFVFFQKKKCVREREWSYKWNRDHVWCTYVWKYVCLKERGNLNERRKEKGKKWRMYDDWWINWWVMGNSMEMRLWINRLSEWMNEWSSSASFRTFISPSLIISTSFSPLHHLTSSLPYHFASLSLHHISFIETVGGSFFMWVIEEEVSCMIDRAGNFFIQTLKEEFSM